MTKLSLAARCITAAITLALTMPFAPGADDSARAKDPRQPEYLSDTGVLTFKKKPFMPIGLYHVAADQYALIADNGFNAVQGDASTDLKRFKASLDLAEKHGIAVDVPLYADMGVKKNLANSLEKIRLYGDHPAILCWKIIDEPDIRPEIEKEVPEVYAALKQADPKHPIELTLAFEKGVKGFAQYCDIVQIDRYPVPDKPLTDVADFCRDTVANKKPWQNLTYVVQCGWTADLKTQPTVAQARAMVYLALINGAKGIFWYSLTEAKPAWDLTKTPLWPHMKTINAEIAALSEPILLGEDITGIRCNVPQVQFLAKRQRGKICLLVCNPTDKPIDAVFTLAEGATARSFAVMGGKDKIVVKGGTLSVRLGAIDSRTLIGD
jgi:hypothetical protein